MTCNLVFSCFLPVVLNFMYPAIQFNFDTFAFVFASFQEMNILFITQLFPYDREARYTSGALREFIEAWSKAGHYVTVVRPHFSYEKEPFPAHPEFHLGDRVQVRFIKPLRIPLLKLSCYSHRKILEGLQMKPDVLICHLYNSYFAFYKLAQKLRVPLIIGIHMSDVRLAENRFFRWYMRKIFRHASAFACRSEAYRKSFLEFFPECHDRTFTALSGIPEEYLQQGTAVRRKNRIITVARLIKRKQIDRVLKILADLPPGINWEYRIVGSGPEEQSLKELSLKLGIGGRVDFEGELSRDAVMKELDESDIFILPSYNETLGLVYLEAMARGCITIGSLNEGIDGIIRDGENGYLCDASDEERIRQKLLQVLQLPYQEREAIRTKSLQSVDGFSLEQKAEEYLDHMRSGIKKQESGIKEF